MESILLPVIPKDVYEYVVYKYLLSVPKYVFKSDTYKKIAYNNEYIHLFNKGNASIYKKDKKIKEYKTTFIPKQNDHAFYKIKKHVLYEICYYAPQYKIAEYLPQHYNNKNVYLVPRHAVEPKTQTLITIKGNILIEHVFYIHVEPSIFEHKLYPIYNENNPQIRLDNKCKNITFYKHKLYVYNNNEVYIININNTDLCYLFSLEKWTWESKLDIREQVNNFKNKFKIEKKIISPIKISAMYRKYVLSINEKSIEMYNIEFKLLNTIFVRETIKKIYVSREVLFVKCPINTYAYFLS